MNQAEHLEWAKNRALYYVDCGQLQFAIDSLISDLKKHPELANHSGIELTYLLLQAGHLQTTDDLRSHIKGFN